MNKEQIIKRINQKISDHEIMDGSREGFYYCKGIEWARDLIQSELEEICNICEHDTRIPWLQTDNINRSLEILAQVKKCNDNMIADATDKRLFGEALDDAIKALEKQIPKKTT